MNSFAVGVFAKGSLTSGESASAAVSNVIALASSAERLGYSRIWVSEHHEVNSAWASPVPLMALICAATSTIRVGTATLILALHKPIAIAESFAFLESNFPNRLDCGVGGAFCDPAILVEYEPGACDEHFASNVFEERLTTLLRYFRREYPANHRLSFGPTPIGMPPPQLWTMVVNGEKWRVAARHGTALCYSALHTRSRRERSQVLGYIDHFQPSSLLAKPKVAIAINVACSPEHDTAKRMTERLGFSTATMPILGTPAECVEQLAALSESFFDAELIVKFEGESHRDRAEACEILGEELARQVRPADPVKGIGTRNSTLSHLSESSHSPLLIK